MLSKGKTFKEVFDKSGVPSPVTRLAKSYGCQAKSGQHMVDISDSTTKYVIANVLYERYADQIISATQLLWGDHTIAVNVEDVSSLMDRVLPTNIKRDHIQKAAEAFIQTLQNLTEPPSDVTSQV